MPTQTLEFNTGGLNAWTDEFTFEVTRDAIIAYAEATNDPIGAHRRGDVAPPVFAIVPVFDALLEPALEVVPLSVLGKVLHGEQDFRFHRPIVPGDVLTARGTMLGLEGMANGTRCHVVLECRGADGELVNEQHVTFFVRGVNAGETIGPLAPEHRFDESLREREPDIELLQHVDDDQTFRYGPAAGDPMPIHLDEQVALDSGLPGIIAHGLCTMAFTSWAVLTEVGGSDVSRLKRLAVRFARPVLPGQDLLTRLWTDDGAAGITEGTTVHRYETSVGDSVVIQDGLAELTP